MIIPRDLHDIPEWRYIGREAALARHLIGTGVTALGHANYADKVGDYYTAFFGLSIGLERLAKLIFVADYAIDHAGKMPDEMIVRKYGHGLSRLMNAVDVVGAKYEFKLEYGRPTSSIVVKIVECLDAFADASRGRYANFGALGDPSLGTEEPVGRWWSDVAEDILAAHFYGKPVEARVRQQAGLVDAMMSRFSVVLHTDEKGGAMQDIYTASFRTGQTVVVQKYGRFYSLTLVRWLCDVLSSISRMAFCDYNLTPFFGVWEHFYGYRVDDSFLKRRKVWPLV